MQCVEGVADLFSAAFSGDAESCRALLQAGVDVDVQTKADLDGVGTGATALHVAASRGHTDVVAVLLEAGSQATALTRRGESALQLATRNGHVDVVRTLSQAGAAPLDAESAMRVLARAPAWDEKKKRKLSAAMAPQQHQAHGRNSGWRGNNNWNSGGGAWGSSKNNA